MFPKSLNFLSQKDQSIQIKGLPSQLNQISLNHPLSQNTTQVIDLRSPHRASRPQALNKFQNQKALQI